jgi:glycosyltransferase involved in cell wall biosynthesis
MPLFSVVIPTFNRARLVGRAIASVLAQTLGNFEVIVVDDGSTDETPRVVEGVGDPRVRLISLPANRGAAAARNAGISAARGELISLLDSDDEYEPEFLEKTRAALAGTGPEVGFCWTGTRWSSRSDKEGLYREQTKRRIWSPTFPSRHAAWRYCLTHDAPWGTSNGVTFKAAVFAKSGPFDEAMLACEDMDLLIRLMRDFDFVVIPECLVIIHDDAAQRVDGHRGNQADAWARMYAKYADDIRGDSAAVRFFLTIIARSYRESGRRFQSSTWALRLIMRRPLDRAAYRLLLRSMTGLARG